MKNTCINLTIERKAGKMKISIIRHLGDLINFY